MKAINVLVVDDAAFVRDLIKKGLRNAFPGFRMHEAPDGRNARMQLEKGGIDLVLCDWEMPNMSGDQLLEWVRGNPETASLPFVMITSRGDREHVMRAVQLGANNYIVKPFTGDKLVDVVSKVMVRALGVSAKQLRGAGAAEAKGMALSGALPIAETIDSRNPPPKPARPSEPPKPPEPAPAREPAAGLVRPAGKVLVQLRYGGGTVRALVKEADRQRLAVVLRRDGPLPGILDLAVFDLEHEGEVARINGYVHTLQARENSQESEFINMTVELIDDDADKLALIERWLGSLS